MTDSIRSSEAALDMGPSTLVVPMSLHAENRQRLVKRMQQLAGETANAVLLFEGGEVRYQYDTDRELRFRQESHFQWLTGVREPGNFVVIDLRDGRTTLFIPRLPETYVVWEGELHPPEHYRAKYAVDEVLFTDELRAWLTKRGADKIHTLRGVNSDSGQYTHAAHFDGIEQFAVDATKLYDEVCECRVFKTPKEIAVMRYVARVSSEAHKAVMRRIEPGLMEYHAESLFCHETYSRGGCRFQAYTCICGTGKMGAHLHYGQNDVQLRDGDMMLLDMGAEYHGYTSDITCTYPVNGRFTPQQREVYEIVYAAWKAVAKAARPGVSWADMHRLSLSVIGAEMLQRDFLCGSLDALQRHHIPALFMPHGLGHLLGCDTHDVGGYLPHCPPRVNEPSIKYLRTARILQAGMVVTIEPGVYFNAAVLQASMDDPVLGRFFNKDKVASFFSFGGCRLEDDVLITERGVEFLSSVPRTIEDIEAEMAKPYTPFELTAQASASA